MLSGPVITAREVKLVTVQLIALSVAEIDARDDLFYSFIQL